MTLTRPQRRRLYLVCYAVLAFLGLWLFWGPMPNDFHANTATATGAPLQTEDRMHFGVMKVAILKVIRTYNPNTTAMASRQTEWEWSPVRTAISVLATIVMLLMIPIDYRRNMRKDQLKGLCDECGYDLTGLSSERCPECGQVLGGSG